MQPAGLAWAAIFSFVIAFEYWAGNTNHWTLSQFIWYTGETHKWFKYFALSGFLVLLNHLFGR